MKCRVHHVEVRQDINGVPFCPDCRHVNAEELERLMRTAGYLAKLAEIGALEAEERG